MTDHDKPNYSISFKECSGWGDRKSFNLDTSNLPPDRADVVRDLVQSSRFFDLPHRGRWPEGRAQFDGTYWIITISDGERSHWINRDFLMIDDGAGALIQWLEKYDEADDLRSRPMWGRHF